MNMFGITEETIYKQLRNYHLGIILMSGIGGVLLLIPGILCVKGLGWDHILSLLLLVFAFVCFAVVIFQLYKLTKIRNHPVLIRYGGAERLAARINAGLRDPRYLAYSIDGKNSLVTLISDDFIVAGNEWTGLTELKEILTVQPSFIPKTYTVMLGDPLIAVPATLAVNKIGDAYWESKGLNSETKFDYLTVTDINNNKKMYGVQHKDMEKVLRYLLENHPHIKIVP